jgi:hypothetical protein
MSKLTPDQALNLRIAQNLKNINTLQQQSYNFWKWFIILFLLWLFFTYIRVAIKYKSMIKLMKEAKSKGSYYFYPPNGAAGPSPIWIATIMEYPWLAFFEEQNSSLSTAIVFTYYSSSLNKTMGIGLKGKPGSSTDYLYQMLQESRSCFGAYKKKRNCDVYDIICAAFPNNKSCKTPCKTGPPFNAGLVYTQSIIQGGSGLAFLGHMGFASNALKGAQGYAAVGGFVVGGAIGIWNAYNEQQKHKQQQSSDCS